jgi:hypothetical protein
LQKTDVAEVPHTDAPLPSVEAQPPVADVYDAHEDQHLAQEHRLKKLVAYVRDNPKTAGPPARKGSAIRMERFRAKKDAQGFVQAYVPADIVEIAKADDGGWQSMRVAIGVGRRALALRGWRAKVVALLLRRA